ncbi:MAG: hypothetical protein HY319_24110 [Armatimonadetes bacterium]|nr:hypothetical protein [Armatimonadota bacterium]
MKSNRRGGYLLVLTLFVMAALFFFALAFLRHFQSQKSLAQMHEQTLIAEEAAKAGLDAGLNELRKDPSWKSGYREVRLPHSGAIYTMSFDPANASVPHSTHNVGGSSSRTGSGARVVPPGFIHLVCVGRYEKARRTEEVLVTLLEPRFQHALFGAGRVRLGGTIMIDSYDSTRGPYSTTNSGRRGNVSTYNSAPGSIYLSNVDIRGTLGVGPGGSEALTVQKVGRPTYDRFEVSQSVRDLPVVPAPMGPNLGNVSVSGTRALPPGTYSDVSLSSGSVLELEKGDYVFTGRFDLVAQARVRIKSGPVNLFLLSDMQAQSGSTFENLTGLAKDFVIYGGSSPQQLSLQGLSSAHTHFNVYAPRATLLFGGGTDFFGSFVADAVEVNGNARFHHDESLVRDIKAELLIRAYW